MKSQRIILHLRNKTKYELESPTKVAFNSVLPERIHDQRTTIIPLQ